VQFQPKVSECALCRWERFRRKLGRGQHDHVVQESKDVDAVRREPQGACSCPKLSLESAKAGSKAASEEKGSQRVALVHPVCRV
jgi:hypothetical protein